MFDFTKFPSARIALHSPRITRPMLTHLMESATGWYDLGWAYFADVEEAASYALAFADMIDAIEDRPEIGTETRTKVAGSLDATLAAMAERTLGRCVEEARYVER